MSALIKPLQRRAIDHSPLYLQRFGALRVPGLFHRAPVRGDNPVFRDTLLRREPQRRHRFVVFIDANVAASFPALGHEHRRLRAAARRCARTAGGAAGGAGRRGMSRTTRPSSRALQQRLVEWGVDRHAFVVGIGGGAFLDLIGYVASPPRTAACATSACPPRCWRRTTPGVGVKNGVNAFGMKNLLGSFAPPFAVLNDADFLRTLQPRDKSPAWPRRSRWR
jgi:3-dehydroquinate synthase